MADKAHTDTDKQLARMERRLSEIYAKAEKEIIAKADEYFKQFDALDKKKRQQVQDGKLTEYEYGRWRRNKIMYGRRWARERDRIVEKLKNVRKTALAYINGELPEVYSINYNFINNNIGGQVKGYSFDLINPDTARNLAAEDQTFLPYKEVNLRKYQQWCTSKVNSAIMGGIISGDSIPNLAKRLANVTTMDRNAAVRNARTMVTSAENKARQDGFERATNNGIIIKREWIAAIDNRTRHAHVLLDGQLADVDKPFDSELGEIMYPGDPAADPANVYNCRCTLGSKVIGFEKQSSSGKVLISEADSGIIEGEDIQIGRSLGAKAQNYDVMDLNTGEIFSFAEGSRLQNVEVFAGKGTKKELRIAKKYASLHGGNPEDWQHVKGFGDLVTDDGERRAEVHWMQCEGVGKFDFFVKEWLD